MAGVGSQGTALPTGGELEVMEEQGGVPQPLK